MHTSRSLFWRNAFFTVLQPGLVAIAVPLWIANGIPSWHGSIADWCGLLLFTAGVLITLICIARFATDGDGTLSPADPTRKLVVRGLYRYSRNPMYVGVALMLLGDCLVLQMQSVWIYAGITMLIIHLFIIGFEEPRLTRDFGEEYNAYRKKVRRWF
jgi:protein-S-isoprenylcysteine O-methyltransferase Ste14